MKIRKAFLSLILAAVMLLSCITPAMAEEFKFSPWFRINYLEMVELDLVPEAFKALDLTQPITRQEMCDLAVPALESITGNAIEPERMDYFSDTQDLNVVKARELGIISGYTDGTYRPDNHLTRQEFFVVVQNFCKAAAFQPNTDGASIASFPDQNTVADWAMESALVCVKYGYVNGSLENGVAKLKPRSELSRQEAMTMFLRCFKGLSEYYYYVANASVVALSGTGGAVTMVGDVTVTAARGSMYVNTDKLNVRNVPSVDGTVLATVNRWSEVVVTGVCSNGWLRINHRGNVGYVASEYLATEAGSTTVASSTAVEICNEALKYLGYPYVWGAESPKYGFDCSGLVYYVFEKFGYKMKRVADDQMDQGTLISADQLLAGDLVFFGYGSYSDHVGIYIGNGNFVHAANPRSGVKVSSMSETYYANKYLCAKRIVTE